MGSVPVHFAWSRDLYRSAAVTFTVYAQLLFHLAFSHFARLSLSLTLRPLSALPPSLCPLTLYPPTLQLLSAAAGSGDDRQAQGVGTTLSRFVQAIDPILGPQNQALDWIGPTGIMLHRMGSRG